MEPDVLDRKLTHTFAGRVVRKDLLHQIKGGENVPSYVLEYLLGKYCASDDEDEIRIGIEAVKETLRTNYFRHDEANKAQAKVEQLGRHRFIDRVEVRFLPSENKYWASMDNFGYTRIHIPADFYRRFERLLEGGIWAIVDVEFRVDAEKNGSPFHITELKPIQLARFDFDEYCQGRRDFSTDEWLDVLMRSAGLEGTRFDRRLKLLLLSRFPRLLSGITTSSSWGHAERASHMHSVRCPPTAFLFRVGRLARQTSFTTTLGDKLVWSDIGMWLHLMKSEE